LTKFDLSINNSLNQLRIGIISFKRHELYTDQKKCTQRVEAQKEENMSSEREKEKYMNDLLDDMERLREKICDDLDTDDEDEFDSDLDEDTVFCKLNC
jgi:hypothetical protein